MKSQRCLKNGRNHMNLSSMCCMVTPSYTAWMFLVELVVIYFMEIFNNQDHVTDDQCCQDACLVLLHGSLLCMAFHSVSIFAQQSDIPFSS